MRAQGTRAKSAGARTLPLSVKAYSKGAPAPSPPPKPRPSVAAPTPLPPGQGSSSRGAESACGPPASG
eukprot:12880004-Alexandrium_andersonii.AAC.1